MADHGKPSPPSSQDGAPLADAKAEQQQPSRTSSRRPSLITHPHQPVLLSLVPSTAASVAPVTTNKSEEIAQEHVADGTGHLKGLPLILALTALNLSTILIFLDNSILSTATPTITNQFHSVNDIGWYVSAYQLALSALQPMTGKLFTYLPNKQTYIASLLLFELASLLCGLSTSSNMLIGGRAVAGLGASGLFNGALTIVAALVPLRRRPVITGILMGTSQLGLIGGPLIGGALTQYSTWRWCFYINLPIGGVAAIALAAVRIPEQVSKPKVRSFLRRPGLWRRFDLVGTALLVPSVVMLLLALHYGGGGTYPWSSATVIGLFCGAGAVGVLFVAWEWRVGGEDAMVPLSMFRERVVVAGCLTNLCLFSCSSITAYFLPLYFQSIQGSSPFTAGIHMLPGIISQLITAVLSGFAVSKLGYYLPWAILSAVLSSVGAGLISTWTVGTNTGTWIGYQIVLGVGRGAGMQVAVIAVQAVLQPSQIAVAMAMLTFIQGLGSAVLISVANTVFDDSLASQIRENAPQVNPQAVIAAGATAFREVVPVEDLPAVIRSYAISFQRTFYLAITLSALCFFTSLGLGNRDVRAKQQRGKGGGVDDSGQETKGDASV
ncbi:major facilitator superfamily transporter [Diaporthe helianthi]|uniref:Major facilitator superfamily transporter n=1 Tax=Diaporthe helianthi TaxID=158607 RepID=A0A2P5ICG0_DIAHE|nr:major facilitator superfamily transporter [Diaporthe helianthi]